MTSPLRLLIAADTFPPNVNGAATFTQNLASGMAARGLDVHVVTPAASKRHGTWYEEYDGQRITVHRLPSDRWWPHDWLRYVKPWRARAHMREVLDRVQPDVIHYQSAVVLGRAAVREGASRGIRIIGTNHLMLENMLEHTQIPKFLQGWASGIWWRDAHKTFAETAALTTPTRRAADFLEQNGNLHDVLAISCGLRTSNYTPKFQAKSPRRILFVGRVTGEKQIDVLLRAFAKLEGDDLFFDVVGTGDQLQQLQRLANELGVAERSKFHGYVTDQELRKIYTEATVFAIASIAELQSIATMEAMASGLPVVAANSMALPHLVHDGETGLLFEPGNVEDAREKLQRVLDLPRAQREALGQGGLMNVQAHDIDTTMELFERLYRGESVQSVGRDSVNEQDHSLDGLPKR
ncbi:glycosyltransferase [Gulosibacter sp. ACHW.36C]|uniref:D-inositol 3-phosphate glycosyltransferase n=1 Tax=Gulosibacter sediminis TaxID=1729695 RepID=A0ABY4N2X4_9MICO|nr:glycosyltransferase [Gulosibacter sediminis]UQN15986.1 glycosyltransferase [Gulosibacter sediminis]